MTWRRLLAPFDRLAPRLTLLLILGLAGTLLLAAALFAAFRPGPMTLVGVRFLVQELDAVADEFFALPRAEREAAVGERRIAGATFRLAFAAEPPRSMTEAPRLDGPYRRLAELLRTERPGSLVAMRRPGWLEIGPPGPRPPPGFGAPDRPSRRPFGGEAVVSPRFDAAMPGPDGSWLLVSGVTDDAYAVWLPLSLVAGTILLFSALATVASRLMVRPMRALADAADRLGSADDRPVAESGPVELRAITSRFNEMRVRIRRLLDDRTLMIAALSHDLRTPLTRLRLRAEYVADEAVRERMLRDIAEMEAMIAETMDFAGEAFRGEPPVALDLASLVSAIAGDRADLGDAVEVEGPDHLVVQARPAALKRALVNVIDNACVYGGGARVRIEADAGAARVVVADDGPGLPEAELERIFQPFYRTEASRSRRTGGSGLGLTVARSILRAHGGDVTAANRQPHGLAVTLTLPRQGDRSV